MAQQMLPSIKQALSAGKSTRWLRSSRGNKRMLATVPDANAYNACVVGSGPGGLTAVSNLLDQGLDRILWIDKNGVDKAGRLSNYREVPSNTKVATFVDYAYGTDAFKKVIREGPPDNAVDRIAALNQDEGCSLRYAGDMVVYLKQRLSKDKRVSMVTGELSGAKRQKDNWNLSISSQHRSHVDDRLQAPLVVLATGSHPVVLPSFSANFPHLQHIDLDTVLTPSLLERVGLGSKSRVAVIGSSHSAILALRNLYMTSIPVTNFYRSPLKYAEYKDGWILYDNTGLKGIAATWAKETLSDDPSDSYKDPLITRIRLPSEKTQQEAMYDEHLRDCTHIVQAVGYRRNPVPDFRLEDDTKIDTSKYNGSTGNIGNARGLFGCGIAYPEKVVFKQAGNMEEWAVGLWKFMKFGKKAAPEWVKNI